MLFSVIKLFFTSRYHTIFNGSIKPFFFIDVLVVSQCISSILFKKTYESFQKKKTNYSLVSCDLYFSHNPTMLVFTGPTIIIKHWPLITTSLIHLD